MKTLNTQEVALVSGGMSNATWVVMGWVLGEIIYDPISAAAKDHYEGLNQGLVNNFKHDPSSVYHRFNSNGDL